VVLQGELADTPTELLLQVCEWEPPSAESAQDTIPVEVQALLEQFMICFSRQIHFLLPGHATMLSLCYQRLSRSIFARIATRQL
jgi:hypothetical protein